jgi:hypothetical protein
MDPAHLKRADQRVGADRCVEHQNVWLGVDAGRAIDITSGRTVAVDQQYIKSPVRVNSCTPVANAPPYCLANLFGVFVVFSICAEDGHCKPFVQNFVKQVQYQGTTLIDDWMRLSPLLRKSQTMDGRGARERFNVRRRHWLDEASTVGIFPLTSRSKKSSASNGAGW